MKKICLLPLFLLALPCMAYRDHRGVAIDSLEAMLTSANPPKGKELLGVYLDLMRGYQNTDGRRAVKYAKLALPLTYKFNAFNSRESVFYHLGLHAYGRDEFDMAVRYFEQALAVTDSMHNDSRYTPEDIDDNLSQIYGALGNLYNMQDKLLLAIEYYQKALPIFERNGWHQSECILYHNVGELYLSMDNNAKAEANYQLALAKAEATGDSLMMALPRKGLLKIYLAAADYDRAQEAATWAYRYYHAHRAEEPGDYAEVLASMARLNLMSGHRNMAAAKAYADEALSLARGQMMSETRCDVYAASAQVAMEEGRWAEALGLALQSVHPDSLATYGDASSYHMLAEIYTELGDKAKTKEYVGKMRSTMERFASEHYQSGLSQMEVIYETEKKQEDIARLTREKRWYLWGGVLAAAVLLLTALLFFLLWSSVRLNRKAAVIKARLDGELAERVRISRDLHDRLGGLLTALKLEMAGTGCSPEALALADDAMREMRNVAHHLLPDSLGRWGLKRALRDFCLSMRKVDFAYTGEERHVQHEEAIYCIVHELVNNAVKSADAGRIRVDIIVADDHTTISVADNGKGLSPGMVGLGQGLAGIEERVATLGGQMDILSLPGEGTEINIDILNNRHKND